jgi:hypothetical protein
LACDAGLEECNGGCVDFDTDPDNCGACGNRCPGSGDAPTETKCSQGSCVVQCAAGETDCSDACVNLTVDQLLNCGGCGISCADANICTADSCLAGECSNLSGNMACDDGNPCTQESCDPVTGCVPPVVIPQQDIVNICAQTLNMNPNTSCVWCNPAGDMCNDAQAGLASCSVPQGNTYICGTCNMGTNPPSCDTSIVQPCTP